MSTAHDTNRSTEITSLLEEHIRAGDFPSAVYLIGENDRIVFTDALGHSAVEPYRVTNKLDTIYDLASLTKPLVTGLLCAKRIELGELTLDSSVSHYLPEFDRTDKSMITIRELLTHTAGLPAWRPVYLLAEDEPERARARLPISIWNTNRARAWSIAISDLSRWEFCWRD